MSSIDSNFDRNVGEIAKPSSIDWEKLSDKVTKVVKTFFPLAAVAGLFAMNSPNIVAKLVAAPIVAAGARLATEAADPLARAIANSILNLKDFYKQPLSITVPTTFAFAYGWTSGTSVGNSAARAALLGWNSYNVSTSKDFKDFSVNMGTAAGAIYGLYNPITVESKLLSEIGNSLMEHSVIHAGATVLKEVGTGLMYGVSSSIYQGMFYLSSKAVVEILSEPFRKSR